MSENGFVKVDWGFGSFESHLAPLVRGWRGLPAVRSYSFCMQQATTGCAPRLKKGTPGRTAGSVAFPDRRSGRLGRGRARSLSQPVELRLLTTATHG